MVREGNLVSPLPSHSKARVQASLSASRESRAHGPTLLRASNSSLPGIKVALSAKSRLAFARAREMGAGQGATRYTRTNNGRCVAGQRRFGLAFLKLFARPNRILLNDDEKQAKQELASGCRRRVDCLALGAWGFLHEHLVVHRMLLPRQLCPASVCQMEICGTLPLTAALTTSS